MLLMSGLMLADRAITLENRVKVAEAEVERVKQTLKDIPREIRTVTKEVEVPTIPSSLLDSLAELSARAESAADNLEEKVAKPAV
jgi:cell division protein ZapA